MQIGYDLLIHRLDSIDDTTAMLDIGPPGLVALRCVNLFRNLGRSIENAHRRCPGRLSKC